MARIGQECRLCGKALRLLPFVLQFLREGKGILHAFHSAAGTWVAVPIPGAAHIICRFKANGRDAEPAQAMQ